MLPLVTVMLLVKAHVKTMDRRLPQQPSIKKKKNIHEIAANCWKPTHVHSGMHVQTLVPSWFDVIC